MRSFVMVCPVSAESTLSSRFQLAGTMRLSVLFALGSGLSRFARVSSADGSVFNRTGGLSAFGMFTPFLCKFHDCSGKLVSALLQRFKTNFRERFAFVARR